METLATKILSIITKYSLYLVIFLIPLFFLPYTAENLEMNKYFLFYILVIISLISYLGRAVMRKSIEFKRSPLDIPILILWAVLFMVTLLSQERYLSFFGDFSFLSFSFVGLSFFFIFYFLVVQVLSGIDHVLKAVYLLLISGGLGALYFILRMVKLFVWPAWPLPAFSPVHASNTLFGIFLAVILLLSLGFLAVKKHNLGVDIFSFVTLILSGVALLMIGFKVVWIIVAIALFLMLVFFLTHVEEVRTVWTSVAFAILIMSLLFIFLGVPRFFTVNLPLEVSLGGNVSWHITTSVLKDGARNFIFGTGPATFMYDFSQFRPADFNNNFAWNIRFRQPFNTAFEIGSTTGLLGALAFLLVILMVLGLVITVWLRQILEVRRKKKTAAGETDIIRPFSSSPLIFWSLVGGWFTLMIAFFTVNFGAVHWLLFWLFLGLMVGAGMHLSRAETSTFNLSLKASPQYALAVSFGFILIFTAIIVLGIYLGRFFVGEVVYARALAKPIDARLAQLQQAVNLNPNRVLFYLTLADSYLSKAVDTSNKTNDINAVTPLVASGVNAAKIATDKAPNNVASWEFLSIMYSNARPIAPGANSWVISSLDRAAALEPTNPTFYINLGNAKLLEKRYSEAKDDFEKAIALKPDLLTSYLRLSFLKEEQRDISGAIATLEKGLAYGRQDALYVFHLGRYYFNRNQKGDWGLAEIAYLRALALNPNYSDALYALALLYERTDHKPQALELYRRVLQLNPGNKDIKNKIESLSGA